MRRLSFAAAVLMLFSFVLWTVRGRGPEANRPIANRSGASVERLPVTVTGRLLNYQPGAANLYLIHSQPGVQETRDPIEIDEQGHFEYTLSSCLPLDARLMVKGAFPVSFIYHPGDAIEVSIDLLNERTKNAKTTVFSGSRAETNNSLAEFQAERQERDLGYGVVADPDEKAKLGVAEYLVEMDRVREQQAAFLEEFLTEHELNDEARAWVSLFAFETYYYYLDYYTFENEPPADYYDRYDTLLPINPGKMLCWGMMRDRVNIHTMHLSDELLSSVGGVATALLGNPDKHFIEYAREHSGDATLAQLAIAHKYAGLFAVKEVRGYESNADLIGEALSDPRIYQSVYDSYLEVKGWLERPRDESGAILSKIKKGPAGEAFEQILAKNRGKVIYLDCWATWCSPCLKAMKESETLASQVGREGVAYVYVCVESPEEIWKARVAEHGFEGAQHVFLDEEQSVSFKDAIKANGLPTYLLIDQEGTIVERGGHLGPGSERAAQRLRELRGDDV